jgi:hypothetical protein
MIYNSRYYFTFYADRDTRVVNGIPDEYLCRILQLDYDGSAEEIQAQQDPVQITYQNTDTNKLQPIIGSQCTLNLIATEDFQLEDLYTENEREFMVQVYRKETPNILIVNWELEEDISGVDANLEILVNGVQIINQFNSGSGTFNINRGDTVLIKSFSFSSSPGINGVNLEITGIPTQRSVTFPFSIDTSIVPTTDITVFLQSTTSATDYTAIRSAVFEKACDSGEGSSVVFTQYYDSVTSQAAAQALADGDTFFDADGQDYADAEGVCYVSPGEFSDLIYQGFIIPDGCQEAFTFSPYPISINAVDGLGLLKNLSYVQNSGDFYLGKQSFIEVIQACLVRLEAPALVLNTCVNIYPDTETQGDNYDPLGLTYVNAERYIKDDQFTPMNCEEVLRSILEEWTAVMIQSSGEWYIYRPNELALSGDLTFRRYLEGYAIYDSFTETKNLDLVLGGESEGVTFAPYFHINTDQLKMIDKPYKNASMSYKYGVKQFPDEELANPNLEGAIRGCVGDPALPCDDVTIPGYTKTGFMELGNYPGGGLTFFNQGDTSPILTDYYENDNLIPVTLDVDIRNYVRFTIDYINPAYIYGTDMNFVISLDNGLDTYYLQADLTWVVPLPGLSYFQLRSDPGTTGQAVITSAVVPTSGNITFRILAPTGTVEDIVYTRISANVLLDLGEQVGEIHTATQTGKFTFVPDTIDVFNGDSPSPIYLGAMYLSDETTLTDLWERRDLSESILAEPYAATKPFLRIAVEEKQRLYAGPFVRFEGSIFNYFNPLQRWSVNLLTGFFMNTALEYNLQQNICKATLSRIANEEIAMDYTLEPDYGATTKVTVKGTP